jgi:thymidylate synthase
MLNIKATTIPDAWYQALYNLCEYDEETNKFKNATLYQIQKGSFEDSWRLEFPFITIEITNPLSRPFIPDTPPDMLGLPPIADMQYIYTYFANYIMNPIIPANEIYSYGNRICMPLIEHPNYQDGYMSQLDILIDRLFQTPYSNQLILQIAEPKDILLVHPPCYRSCQFKVIDGRLDFHILFRSNDLYNAFCVNIGSMALLMDYIVKGSAFLNNDILPDSDHQKLPSFLPGKIIYIGSGLHLYESSFQAAAMRLRRPELIEQIAKAKKEKEKLWTSDK